MIEKMKFLSITGPKADIDRVVNGVTGIGHNLGRQDLVEQVRDLRIILAKHTTLQAQEQRQIVAQLLGDLDLGETLPGLGIRADSVNEAVDHGSDARRGFGYRLVA